MRIYIGAYLRCQGAKTEESVHQTNKRCKPCNKIFYKQKYVFCPLCSGSLLETEVIRKTSIYKEVDLPEKLIYVSAWRRKRDGSRMGVVQGKPFSFHEIETVAFFPKGNTKAGVRFQGEGVRDLPLDPGEAMAHFERKFALEIEIVSGLFGLAEVRHGVIQYWKV